MLRLCLESTIARQSCRTTADGEEPSRSARRERCLDRAGYQGDLGHPKWAIRPCLGAFLSAPLLSIANIFLQASLEADGALSKANFGLALASGELEKLLDVKAGNPSPT